MLKKAQALIAAGDLEAILDYGSELNEEIKAALIELTHLKSAARDEAIKRNKAGEATPVKLPHTYGKTSVSIPGKVWKAKKGKNPLDLEDELPEEIFDALFETPRKIVLKDDFEKQIKKLSQEHRDIVKRYMEHVAENPSVTFPALPAQKVTETVIAKVNDDV